MKHTPLGIALLILAATAWGTSVWERSPWDKSPVKSESDKTPDKTKAAAIDTADTFTDSRDGTIYRTVTVNGKKWMAENLRYRTSQSTCFNNDPDCPRDGRLYTWHDASKACPPGSRLPRADEWDFALSSSILRNTLTLSGFRAFNHDYYDRGTTGVYWTADENPDYTDYAYYFKWEYSQWVKKHFYKDQANSVRCIIGKPGRNAAESGSVW